MKTKKVKIESIEGVDIFFSPEKERFVAGDIEFRDFYEAKRWVAKSIEEKFDGEFFVKSYDGINKFVAKKKVYDTYDDCYKIFGHIVDKYNSSKKESFGEKELYPISKENSDLFLKSLNMDSDGWALIEGGKALKDKLKWQHNIAK